MFWADGAIWFAKPGEQGRKLKKHSKHPDAPLSPYFVSLRTPDVHTHGQGTLSEATVAEMGCQLLGLKHLVGSGTGYVAPIPNAAMAYGTAMLVASAKMGRGLLLVPLVKEGEGVTRKIVGVAPGFRLPPPGLDCDMVDDLITGADTKEEAADALSAEGFVVRHLFVVLDREQGGVQRLAQRGISTHALMTWSWLVDFLLADGLITATQYENYKQYLEDDRTYNQANGI